MLIQGIVIDNLLSALDLNQIICEPTNFEEEKNPSCIDLNPLAITRSD